MESSSGKFYPRNLRKLNSFLKQYAISPESPQGDVTNWRIWHRDWDHYKYLDQTFRDIPNWDEVMDMPIFRGKILLLKTQRDYGIIDTISIINDVKTTLDVWVIFANIYFIAHETNGVKFVVKLSIMEGTEHPTIMVNFKR